MSKVRFTQLFNESMSAKEIYNILSDTLTGKELDELEDDYGFDLEEADFVKKYEDKAEKAKGGDSSKDEPTKIDDSTTDDSTTDDSTNNKNVAEPTDTPSKAEANRLMRLDAAKKKILATCTMLNLKDGEFSEWEKYFGYNELHEKKDEIPVLFDSPYFDKDEKIKKTDPRFESVAAMNECALVMMAQEIMEYGQKFNVKDENGKDVDQEKSYLHTILGDIANKVGRGKDTNLMVKGMASDTFAALQSVLKRIDSDTAQVTDPATGETKTVSAKLLKFIYSKIVPSVISAASGTAYTYSVQNDVLRPGPYQNFYKSATGVEDQKDIYQDAILDGFTVFLGGIYAVRSMHQDILGTPHVATAGATALAAFDRDLAYFSSDKNPFERMRAIMEQHAAEWGWENVKKVGSAGRIKNLGAARDATLIAQGDRTIDSVQIDHDTGVMNDKDYNATLNSMGSAKSRVTTVKVKISPFAMLASKVQNQYANYLKAITRAGFKKYGFPSSLFGARYWSKESIENAKDDATRNKMIEDNKKWEGYDWSRVMKGDISLDMNNGDDDKGSLLDTLSQEYGSAVDFTDVDDLSDSISTLKTEFEKRFNMSCLKVGKNDDETLEIQIRSLLATMASAKFVYMGVNHPSATVRNALDATFGKVLKRKAGKDVYVPDVKPDDLLELGTKNDFNNYSNYMGGSNKDLASSFGVRDFNFRSAILAVRSAKAYYIFNKTKEGPEMLDNLNSFLQNISDKCSEMIIKLAPNNDVQSIYKSDMIATRLKGFLNSLNKQISEVGDHFDAKSFDKDNKTLVDWLEAFSINNKVDDKFLNNLKTKRPDIVDAINQENGIDIGNMSAKDASGFVRDFGTGEYTLSDTASGHTTRDNNLSNMGHYVGGHKKLNMVDLDMDLPRGTTSTIIKESEPINDFFMMVFAESQKK